MHFAYVPMKQVFRMMLRCILMTLRNGLSESLKKESQRNMQFFSILTSAQEMIKMFLTFLHKSLINRVYGGHNQMFKLVQPRLG